MKDMHVYYADTGALEPADLKTPPPRTADFADSATIHVHSFGHGFAIEEVYVYNPIIASPEELTRELEDELTQPMPGDESPAYRPDSPSWITRSDDF
jgi:hypothetical protein